MSIDQTDIELLSTVNLYEILGFNSKEEFSPELAKKMYRKLAIKYHPDKNPCASAEKFERIQLAYLILCTPEYKEQYDSAYDANLQTKGYSELVKSFSTEKTVFKFNKLTDDEFKQQIVDLNNKMSETLKETSLEELLEQRKNLNNDLENCFKDDYELLNKYDRTSDEFNDNFNKIFESNNILTNDDLQNNNLEIAEMNMSYNGGDILCNYTDLKNMDYNSMYVKESTYEESFNINKVPIYINDNKTLEEKMEEYLANTGKLSLMTKNLNIVEKP